MRKKKSIRLINISKQKNTEKNIDELISSFRPAIFWKDKEIVKKQIEKWSLNEIERFTIRIQDIELLIKKNPNSSINILYDFILKETKSKHSLSN